MLRQAEEKDLNHIKQIADRNRKTLGFVLRPALLEAIQRKELLYHPNGAFCHYHRRCDGITTIREICTDKSARGQGLARLMVATLARPIRLKCPTDNDSNGFYRHLGFELAETIPGKSRALNVWILK
jgi:ribosomal protein S18 acetylase RimI-like enzyme